MNGLSEEYALAILSARLIALCDADVEMQMHCQDQHVSVCAGKAEQELGTEKERRAAIEIGLWPRAGAA